MFAARTPAAYSRQTPRISADILPALMLTACMIITLLATTPGIGSARTLPPRPACDDQSRGSLTEYRTAAQPSIICLPEAYWLARSVWQALRTAAAPGYTDPECRNLELAGRLLNAAESVLAYRICILSLGDEPDTNRIQHLYNLQRSILIVDEMLFIIELLTCSEK